MKIVTSYHHKTDKLLAAGYEWKEFDSNLEKLNSTEIIDQLKKLSNGNPIALCCYEKDSGECHRSRVALWLLKNGFHVAEYREVDNKWER
ncbi:DUF488 family protein [Leptospira santarosai]|uniref:DUF488 family protein, N3 subclade n=1 Tax=Leptospira santarosai TaxID=28183 RepID=UPI0026E303E8|nr:DUF488 family protein [Leptospira santarosai]MDO6395334.1 DUF488 family protein [Leptospira santarosai]